MAAQSLHTFLNSNTTNFPLVTRATLYLPPKLPFLWGDLHSHLHCISLHQPNPPPQVTSKSTQTIFRSSLDGHTDRHRQEVHTNITHNNRALYRTQQRHLIKSQSENSSSEPAKLNAQIMTYFTNHGSQFHSENPLGYF